MKLTEEQRAQLAALEAMSDDDIDLSDIPETLDWPKGKRGALYRPVKRKVTLELDEYVIDWFRDNIPDDQDNDEHINQALMEHIRQQLFPSRKATKETAN
jgi:uncharacterized protein (DUF4415 family)